MDENQAKKPMTKTEIVAALSEATGLDKHQVSGLFGELATLIGKNLGEDGPGVFTIPDLLQIKVVRKPAVEEHKAVNPFTKEEMAHDWLPDAVAAPQAVPSHSSISGSSRHSPTSSSASTQRMVLSSHLYITCNIDRQFPTFCVARVTAGPTPASASTTAAISPLATQDGLQRLAQYILRCLFSLARVVRLTDDGSVLYRAEQHHCRRFPGAASADLRGGTRRNFQVSSALDFVAEVTQHIPDKGEHLVRYYGWYSHRQRGLRAKSQSAAVSDSDSKANCQILRHCGLWEGAFRTLALFAWVEQ